MHKRKGTGEIKNIGFVSARIAGTNGVPRDWEMGRSSEEGDLTHMLILEGS